MWVILHNNADWDCFKTLTCGRSWGFEINFWRNIVRFWKSHICSNKLDVEETNFSFTQFNRIWNHLVGHWTEIGWFACSGTMGSNCFCSWKYISCFRWTGETWEWWSQTPQVSQQNRCDGRHWARQEALLYVFEDNEAVIKMIIKRRSPTMRHVSRTHRVALEWLFDRINLDRKIQIKYIETPKNQLADFLTKGNFTRDEWNHLLCLFNISHFSSTVCSEAMAKRSQQDSGEERATAKSRPMTSLVARAPSTLSSASESPGKKSCGNQDSWSAKAEKVDWTGQSVVNEAKPRDGTGNPLWSLKEKWGHSNLSLETMKQNQNCQWNLDHSWTAWMVGQMLLRPIVT